MAISMGEAKVKRSATAKLIQKFPHCCLCGGKRPAVTRDHIPPIALFDNSHRPDKLVVPACDECNRSTSTADLVASIVSRWNPNINTHDHGRLAAQIRRQAPDIIAEWTRLNPQDKIRARQHLISQGVPIPEGAALASIGPRTIKHLNLFSHKLTLGLYFEIFKRGLSNVGRVSAYWRTKEDFARDGLPHGLLDLMARYGTLGQGKWNTAEVFEYRYDFNGQEDLLGCFARLRGGLYILGFAIGNAALITPEMGDDWLRPDEILDILKRPEYEKKATLIP